MSWIWLACTNPTQSTKKQQQHRHPRPTHKVGTTVLQLGGSLVDDLGVARPVSDGDEVPGAERDGELVRCGGFQLVADVLAVVGVEGLSGVTCRGAFRFSFRRERGVGGERRETRDLQGTPQTLGGGEGARLVKLVSSWSRV